MPFFHYVEVITVDTQRQDHQMAVKGLHVVICASVTAAATSFVERVSIVKSMYVQ
jgi:hypothetical protein